jgi:capsular exopolysaccharide synthesis family protein
MDGEAAPDLDVRRYLHGLRRRKLTVLAVVVLAVATAAGLSVLQKRVYGAKAQILLQPNGSTSLFTDASGQGQIDPKLVIDTETKMIESKPVRTAVEATQGRVAKVAASRVDQTLIIQVTGYGSSARRAADVTNAYADAYIALRQSQAFDDLATAGTALQQKLTSLQSQIDQLDKAVNDAPAAQRDAVRTSQAGQRDSLTAQQSLFRQRLDELQVDTQLRAGAARIVARATPPTAPVKPTPVRNVLLALAVGILFGVGLACLQEYLDDSVRTKDDLARLSGLPVIGAIPSFTEPDVVPALATSSEAGAAAAAEAYRSLRTSVQLLGVVRPVTTIQFTSPGVGAGKTTTVANLAAVLAAAGQRVAIVDSDLRRPRLHTVFGLANDRGLTSVLVGETALGDALQPVPGHSGLRVLTAGAVAPNPSELLSLKLTAQVIFDLQSQFDVVLIDSPPVLPVTDAIVMSAWVEAVVVLAASGLTRRNELRAAIDLLKQADAPVVGAVLTRTTREPGYSYSYGYGYGEVEAGGRRARRADHSAPAASRARRRAAVTEQS